MKNEEKAKEISYRRFRDYDDGESINECFESAMETAQWKEQQMIEKAVEYLRLHMPFGEVNESLKNEVIEDFKQAMKEE